MNKELKNRKVRNDKGRMRVPYMLGGTVFRMDLRGRPLACYGSIAEAVSSWNEEKPEHSPVARYSGVWSCICGRQLAHAGFMWKSDQGEGTGWCDVEKMMDYIKKNADN